MQRHSHNIAPVYDKNSRVLILGSFPSKKSREVKFFYGNPQNRFWKVMASIYSEKIPETEIEKRSFLLGHNIALWDVISECDIQGSSDSSIKNVKLNDINELLSKSDIKAIMLNGKTAAKLFKKYFADKLDIKTLVLPSTSPANASCSFDMLGENWSVIKEYTETVLY